jgi:guanylate kinase
MIKQQIPGSVLVFVAPPDLSHLEQRLAARGANSPQEIDDRLEIARKEMAAVDEFQHVITNDDRTRAAAELTDLIRSQLAPQETA